MVRQGHVSVDSENYAEVDSYDMAKDVFDDRELCFTWGTLMPELTKNTKYTKIFFNIIIDQEILKRKYIFIINALVIDKELSVYHHVNTFESIETTHKDYLPSFHEIALAKDKNETYKTKVTFLDDEKYTGEGGGVFIIPRIVQSDEVSKIEEATEFLKKT